MATNDKPETAAELAEPSNLIPADYNAPGILEDIDLGNFVDETTGFYPYWTPVTLCSQCKSTLGAAELVCRRHPQAEVLGNRFIGRLIGPDPDSPANFPRWMVYATHRMLCQRGPVDSPEIVTVEPGGMFTISDFKSLNLMKFQGMVILVQVKYKRKLPPTQDGTPRTMWDFDLKVDHASKRMLDEQRNAIAVQARGFALEQHKRALTELHERNRKVLADRMAARLSSPSSPSPSPESLPAAPIAASKTEPDAAAAAGAL